MSVRIECGEWVLASDNRGYEVYRPGVIQSGANKGKLYKKDRRSIPNLIAAIEELEHLYVDSQEVETWTELKRAYAEFRAQLAQAFTIKIEIGR